MAKLSTSQVKARIFALLDQAPSGLQWAAMLRLVQNEHPETPFGTISGSARNLLLGDERIVKVAKGTYQLARFIDGDGPSDVEPAGSAEPSISGGVRSSPAEAEFYASFAQWLVDTDEVTAAVALGGSILKGKWGTPDVLGVLRHRRGDVLQFEPQIVSAEIKVATDQPVVAFGQAIAYRLFSHKSYIVVPTGVGEDLGRLRALCSLHGVGLVTYTPDPAKPDYVAIIPPVQANPDIAYANIMLDRLKVAAPQAFRTLF